MYTTVNFDVKVQVTQNQQMTPYTIEYPFRFGEQICSKDAGKGAVISIDVSSDARFFVATGVLSILYCIFIVAVYTVIDEIYTSKPEVPLAVNIT